MKLSRFGQKLSSDSAIVSLMDDLGDALNVNPDLLFMGGGNPAFIPEFENEIAAQLQAIASQPDQLHKLIGVYQSPRGSEDFIDALTHYINESLGWSIDGENIAITNGSQSAFFMLINMLAGSHAGQELQQQEHRTIVFPMMPEYLGYSDQPAEHHIFRSIRPQVELIGEHRFKYHIDFDSLELTAQDAAVCLSSPTNPSANVVSTQDLQRLSAMAAERKIPAIIDCAYGHPFPGIVFNQQALPFHENNIYVFSCSKLGLPGARTGIVVGPEKLIKQLVQVNTIVSLANGNLGPAVMTALIQEQKLASICQHMLLPFYRKQRDFALHCLEKYFLGLSWRVHEPEGAFFLWLWFENLPVSSTELYERMKNRGVLIMDGKHFFFGLAGDWDHIGQCIRLTYCQSDIVIEEAIARLAEEIRTVLKLNP